jgi:hypothetical protein
MYSLTKTFDLFGFLFGCPPGKILDEDIHETDESWLVSIDMPGMRTAVRLDGNMLFLTRRRSPPFMRTASSR